MSEEKVVKIVASRTDADIAASIRARLPEAARPMIAILEEAASEGLVVSITIGPNLFGRQAPTAVNITKPL